MHVYDIGQQYRGSSSLQRQQQQHQSAANYQRQLLGNYNALMHFLNCNKDCPALGAATSTVSSASVAIIAASAASAASAGGTRHLQVLPKLADSLAKAYWQTVHVTGRASVLDKQSSLHELAMVLVVVVRDTSMCWS